MNNPLRVLETAHSMSILSYLNSHDGCTKTEIYREVCRNQSLPSRFDAMEAAGLLVQVPDGRAVRLILTVKGRRVAALLEEIESILSDRCPAPPTVRERI